MDVKRNNRSAVLRLLHEQGSMSRKRLSEILSLTPAAITKITGELLNEGLLREGDTIPSKSAGRREIMLELNCRSLCALGVLINLEQAIVSAVWLDGTVIFSQEIPLELRASAEPTVRMLSEKLMLLTEEHHLKKESVIGLGIAIRGICSPDGRKIANSFGALADSDFPICQLFEEITGFPAVMSNNVRALFAAQMYLAQDRAEGAQFFLRCEYGIGASLCVRGRIWHGVTEQCAEIGHIPVIRHGGKLCSCGKRGCLETIASPSAICRDALDVMSEEATPVLWSLCNGEKPTHLSIEDVLSAALSGDTRIVEIVDRAITYLGSALKSVIYLIDPSKIVLYGKMFDNSYYLSHLIAEMQEGVDTHHKVIIEKSPYNHQLENKAACLIAVEDFMRNGGGF